MSTTDDENDGQATERVVIRDRRKIDPKAEAKKSSNAADTSVAGAHRAAEPEEVVVGDVEDVKADVDAQLVDAQLTALRSELDERTHDLQRIIAEYANYRKRVDRDRGAAAEQTTGAVLTALLPLLDDIDRAREHGDLVGPFASVAESLTAVTGKLGLAAFGEKGDAFDPNRHEAVAHRMSADVTEPTCIEVMRRGYTLGERLLRPAMVAVADPE